MKLRWVEEKDKFSSPVAPTPRCGHKPTRAPRVHFLANTQIPYAAIHPAFIRRTVKMELGNHILLQFKYTDSMDAKIIRWKAIGKQDAHVELQPWTIMSRFPARGKKETAPKPKDVHSHHLTTTTQRNWDEVHSPLRERVVGDRKVWLNPIVNLTSTLQEIWGWQKQVRKGSRRGGPRHSTTEDTWHLAPSLQQTKIIK